MPDGEDLACQSLYIMHRDRVCGGARNLYSSLASQGVFVSTTDPFKISFPMMRAAAFGTSGRAALLLALHWRKVGPRFTVLEGCSNVCRAPWACQQRMVISLLDLTGYLVSSVCGHMSMPTHFELI